MHRRIPPLLSGALRSAGISAAFVVFGLGWATVPSLRDPRADQAVRENGLASRHDSYTVLAMEVQRPGIPIWLVDGFNVLHAGVLRGRQSGPWWREAARAQLLELARSFDDPDAEVWIVFDGPRDAPAAPRNSRLRVVFAPSADEWLLRRLRSAPDPSRLGVVTGDRRLAIRSRRRGARVITPREFLDRCRSG